MASASAVPDARFTAIDYGIFIVMLIGSALVGVYYGFVAKKKQNNTAEYLLGEHQITLIPIGVSLIVSYVFIYHS